MSAARPSLQKLLDLAEAERPDLPRTDLEGLLTDQAALASLGWKTLALETCRAIYRQDTGIKELTTRLDQLKQIHKHTPKAGG